MSLIETLTGLHHRVFALVERQGDTWLIGLLARLGFIAVLFGYFWNSAMTKIGDGVFGFLTIKDGAYFQILGETGMVAYDFDTANIPWYIDLVVLAGTWGEIILPLLLVIGLFTRIAAIGMMIFVFVQSYVDIAVHKVDSGTIGALFDRDSASVIMDQRALWMFLFAILVIKGAGMISVDWLLARRSAGIESKTAQA